MLEGTAAALPRAADLLERAVASLSDRTRSRSDSEPLQDDGSRSPL